MGTGLSEIKTLTSTERSVAYTKADQVLDSVRAYIAPNKMTRALQLIGNILTATTGNITEQRSIASWKTELSDLIQETGRTTLNEALERAASTLRK